MTRADGSLCGSTQDWMGAGVTTIRLRFITKDRPQIHKINPARTWSAPLILGRIPSFT